MSWKGFTKAVARLPQRISAKTGYAEETVDSEFVDLYESYKGLESCVRKLHDDSKKFKDALTDMLSHQKKFAATLQEMFQPISSNKSGTPKVSLSDLTKEQAFSKEIETAGQLGISMDRVRENIIPHLQDIERLVIVPALEYLSLFDQVKKYLTKREHKLVDYDRFREAVKKLKDKKDRSSSEEKKLGQLEFQFDAATREYNSYNNLLKTEMPIFLELRVEFIDPCFATFYHCQLQVYETLYKELRTLADANFDMSCSAMNGFVTKWDTAQTLFDELTIPKRRGGKEAQVPAQPALSQSGSNADLPSSGAIDSNPSNYPKSAKSAGVPFATMGAMGAALPQTVQSKKYVIALYDFDAQADGDLSFRRDDKIEVVEKTENQNDWWTGTINGMTGQFPGNYVAEI